MKTLMRGQAKRLPTQPAEVWLDFEAFLLAPSNYTNEPKRTRRQGQQWIHTTVLACVKEEDCIPVKKKPLTNPLESSYLISLYY